MALKWSPSLYVQYPQDRSGEWWCLEMACGTPASLSSTSAVTFSSASSISLRKKPVVCLLHVFFHTFFYILGRQLNLKAKNKRKPSYSEIAAGVSCACANSGSIFCHNTIGRVSMGQGHSPDISVLCSGVSEGCS